MFEINSETGWFKYEGSNVPDEVIRHLENRPDVNLFVQTNSGIEFYSQNKNPPTDLYCEDGKDGFEDYGVISSNAINYPNNLPEELREIIPVEDYFEEKEIIELVEAVGVSGDPRNYILNNTLRFDTSEVNLKRGKPLDLDILLNHEEKVGSNKGTSYPSMQQVCDIKEELSDIFGSESFNISVIGFYSISKDSINIHVDGVAIKSNKYMSEILDWCDNNLSGQRDDLIRNSELHINNGWVRVWCD